jgi:protein involved in polysaccharide export with SLBB domain
MNKFKQLFLLLSVSSTLFAQDLSKLTPAQKEMYMKYMAGKSTTSVQPDAESGGATVIPRSVVSADSVTKVQPALVQGKKRLTNYGAYLFSNQNISFEPKLNIATPMKYVLGTYDEVLIDISGLYEANYKLKVSPEGMVRIPNVGPVKVAGLMIEDATRIIRNQVSKVYMGVPSGETRVNISLGSIRSIRVNVVGEAVRPGTYTLPSLATAFNALYACGGPNEIGSMRDIKVLRSGKVIAHLDVYRFLVDGVLGENVLLHDEDIIKIEPYKTKVIMDGSVKHPAIFQLRQGETMYNLIQFAGGYADDADKSKVTVFRLTEKGKTVVDLSAKNYQNFPISSGDSCLVTSVYRKFENRVDITGAVKRPGAYALSDGMTVKELVQKADGLKENAYLNMAYINRKKENQIPEIIGFNLAKILSGDAKDIALQKDDEIVIQDLFEFREGQKVSISGAVKNPGIYSLIENITLKDLIFKAKGFTEMAATDSIELIRPVKNKEMLATSNIKSLVMKFSLDKDMNFKDGSGDILLENGDQVVVRSISGYEGVRMVRVEGEILHPGSYNITSKAEKISDLIQRTGGYTQYAHPVGAFLIRSESTNPIEQRLNAAMQQNVRNQLSANQSKDLDINMLKSAGVNSMSDYSKMDSIQTKLSGVDVADQIFNKDGIVALNLVDIMNHPGSKYDLKLEEGDIIYVPREQQTVRVIGQVLFPTLVRYDKNLSLKNYINSSGGFTSNANKGQIFVLYANGSAKSTKHFLGFRIYPKIRAGARIVVPEKPVEIKNRLTTAESVGILTSITSVVALLYSILQK